MNEIFAGSYEDLQEILRGQAIEGTWRICDDPNHRQFRAASGAILNYWTTNGRLFIDVDRSPADRELSNSLSSVLFPEGNTLQTLLEVDTPPIAPPAAASSSTAPRARKKRPDFLETVTEGGLEDLSFAGLSRSHSPAKIDQFKRNLERALREDKDDEY
jgi:hypothetical protein